MLLKSDTLTLDDPEFQAAVEDVTAPPVEAPVRRGREVARSTARPRSPPTATPRSSTSRSPATRSRPRTASTPRLAATAAVQAEHPDMVIEQFGGASADKAINATINDDIAQGGRALAADHADHPHDHLRLAGRRGRAAADRPHLGARRARPGRDPEPGAAARRQRQRRDPDDRPRGRSRLLALLPATRARGARRRARRALRARGRRRDLGARGADLRPHRAGRDGGDVHQRRQGLHLVRLRDDDRRRDRDVRLADRAPGDARLARRPGREGADPVPRPAPAPGGRVALLDRGHRSRHPAPVALDRARRRRAGRARDPGAEHEDRDQRRRRPASGPRRDQDLQPGQGRVPERGRDHDRRRRGRRRALRRGRHPDHRAPGPGQGVGLVPARDLGHLQRRRHRRRDRHPEQGHRHRRRLDRAPSTRSATRSSRRPSARSTRPRSTSAATRRSRRTPGISRTAGCR